MKTFLFLLASYFTSFNNLTLFFNNHFDCTINETAHTNIKKQKNKYTVYFNKDKSSRTITESYSTFYKYYNFFLLFNASFGTRIPIYFDEVKMLGKEDCYTKTSWGDTPYYGTELWKKIDGRKFITFASNVKILDHEMLKKYANIELLDIKEYYMSAGIIAKQYVGFSWYFDNVEHKFYFQMFIYFYVETWGSFSAGRQWLNIGKGLDFYY